MLPGSIENMSIINLCKRYHIFNPHEGIWHPTGRGLKDPDALDASLAKGDYKPVLIAIWSEVNFLKKITWLRQKESELHVPLLYELAIAECDGGLHATVTNICYPLLAAAEFRAKQDCYIYPECMTKKRPPFAKLHAIYCEALKDRVDAFITKPKVNADITFNRVANVAVDCLTKKLPSTRWLDPDSVDDEEEDLIARRIYAAQWIEHPN